MISTLRGKLLESGEKHVVLEVQGVGYKVFCVPRDVSVLVVGGVAENTLYTHQYVRENALELYGFVSKAEKDMFEILLTVSGIGPKGALSVLAAAPSDVLKRSIVAEDSSILTRISGIGKKTAEKIILELKDKFGEEWRALGGDIGKESEVVEALMGLGYSRKEAQEGLGRVSKNTKTTEEQVKEALKILGGK